MTISSTNRVAGPYTGNGVTTAFAFNFKVFSAADLYVVRLNTLTLAETVLTITTDYTVTLNTNQNVSPGGTVTMVTAPTSSQKITITSNLSNLQPTDITNQGGFYPSVLNDALDRATIQIQQLADDVSRSLHIPLSAAGIDPSIPYPEAGTILGWSPNGLAITNYDISDVLTVAGSSGFSTQTFSGDNSTTVFTLSAMPGSDANLEVFISGVRQRPITDYSVSAATLTFVVAPGIGTNNILARWGTTLGIGIPSDGSVTPVKLSTGGPTWNAGGTVTASGFNVFNAVPGGLAGALLSNASPAANSTTSLLFWNDNGFSANSAQIAYFSSSASHGGASANEWRLAQGANAPITFYTNGAERMRIQGSGNVVSVSGAIGYGTGAGGTVTQTTNKATAVTLNKVSGQITLSNAALASNTTVGFIFNNSFIAATDVVMVNVQSGAANTERYLVWAGAQSAGACGIYVRNIHTASLSEALVLNFVVIKGAST